MSFEIVEKILNSHNGATFQKVDLHIHTPASNDWLSHNPEPEFSPDLVTPEQIVQSAISSKLNLIAITDHNSVEWCEKVITAAAGKNLVVLPGFELTTRPGIHILALFEPSKDINDLRILLNELGIKGRFGDSSAFTTDSIEDIANGCKIIRLIRDYGGLAIPAHIDVDSGLVGRLKGGEAVVEFLKASGCSILEIKREIPQIIMDAINQDNSSFAIISGSDAHRLDEIGRNSFWAKMDKPSLNGLFQIAYEPLNRIQKTEPIINKKPRIIGLFSNGGHLNGKAYAFNEDLNCIIGGRGAGKSALIDYIRFVFNNEPIDEDLKYKFRKRLIDLVRESTTVYVLISSGNDDFWLFERTLTFTTSKKPNGINIDITSPDANIYKVLVDQKRVVRIEGESPNFRIEFYGQGEVQSITNTTDPNRQLRLIDNFARQSIEQREAKLLSFDSFFEKNEIDIINIREELRSISLITNQYDELLKRIIEIEKDLQDKELKDHQVWEEANTWVENSISFITEQINQIENLKFDDFEEKEFTIPNSKGQLNLNRLSKKVIEVNNSLKKIQLNSQKEINLGKTTIEIMKKDWIQEYTEESERYSSILRSKGAESLVTLNRELAEKRSLCENIKNILLPKSQKLNNDLGVLEGIRNKKITELFTCWEEIRQCRVLAADRMSDLLGGDILVKIKDEINQANYYKILLDSTPTSIRSRESQLQKIIDSLNPHDFIDLLRKRDLSKICSITGITDTTASELLRISEKDMLSIERTRCNDIASITLKIEGSEKSLEDLSEGEKCTAILSVILLDISCPLVIDQPEDELDHAFIMSNVVNTLVKVKQKQNPLDKKFVPKDGRQFIIATHNQNIPVLGDSEMVFKMHKVRGQFLCEYECAAGLEDPVTIHHILSLEGGPDAFRRRRRKYSGSI